MRKLVMAIACAAQLQAMQNAVTLRTDTRVVEIDVTVRDSQGKPVNDLKKSDFTITDDGRPRDFTIFNFIRASTPGPTHATPPPLSLPRNTFANVGRPPLPPNAHSTVILLDAINGWFENYGLSRQAVIGMLDKVPADERIALYVISKGEGLIILQNYTTDHAHLLDAITRYIPRAMCTAPPDYVAPVDPGLPVGSLAPPTTKNSAEEDAGARMKALTAVTGVPGCVTPGPRSLDLRASAAESVRTSLSALAAQLARQPGRKSVFWVSQGFPITVLNGETAPAWNKTFSALNDANVAVNVVDNNGIMGPKRMWGGGAVPAMKQIADATGGRLYFDTNGLDDALAGGIADSRSTYVLGFYLTAVDGNYHELKVSVDRPGIALNYRQGYYSIDTPKVDPAQKKVDLASALLSPVDATAVGIEATLDRKPGTLNLKVRLDPETISLQPGKSSQSGKVEELFVEFNASGREVGRVTAATPFEIRPEDRETYENRGIVMTQSIRLAADAVKLSIVVRDTASGRVGSLAVPLDKVAR